jgi:hypothetical protein
MAEFSEIMMLTWEGATVGSNFDVNIVRAA